MVVLSLLTANDGEVYCPSDILHTLCPVQSHSTIIFFMYILQGVLKKRQSTKLIQMAAHVNHETTFHGIMKGSPSCQSSSKTCFYTSPSVLWICKLSMSTNATLMACSHAIYFTSQGFITDQQKYKFHIPASLCCPPFECPASQMVLEVFLWAGPVSSNINITWLRFHFNSVIEQSSPTGGKSAVSCALACQMTSWKPGTRNPISWSQRLLSNSELNEFLRIHDSTDDLIPRFNHAD